MELRAYRREDFEAVYALDQVCFLPRFRFSRAMMRRVTEGPGTVAIVAWEMDGEGTGRLAGFCAAERIRLGGSRWLGYVATLDVAPAWRGRGTGQILMAAVEARLAGLGAEEVHLHVHTGNAAAVRLYERLGYTRRGEQKDFYGPGYNAWRYARVLRIG